MDRRNCEGPASMHLLKARVLPTADPGERAHGCSVFQEGPAATQPITKERPSGQREPSWKDAGLRKSEEQSRLYSLPPTPQTSPASSAHWEPRSLLGKKCSKHSQALWQHLLVRSRMPATTAGFPSLPCSGRGHAGNCAQSPHHLTRLFQQDPSFSPKETSQCWPCPTQGASEVKM